MWRTLAVREFLNEGDDDNLLHDLVGDGGKYSSYRELYIDYPRVWLTIEAAKIKSKSSKWTATQHIGKHLIECGKCGCNCGNGGCECPGIPIESKFRYDRKERLGYHESRAVVSGGEGYQMSGGSFVVLNHFCEPCFERMLQLNAMDLGSGEVIDVRREDYVKVEAETLYDATNSIE